MFWSGLPWSDFPWLAWSKMLLRYAKDSSYPLIAAYQWQTTFPWHTPKQEVTFVPHLLAVCSPLHLGNGWIVWVVRRIFKNSFFHGKNLWKCILSVNKTGGSVPLIPFGCRYQKKYYFQWQRPCWIRSCWSGSSLSEVSAAPCVVMRCHRAGWQMQAPQPFLSVRKSDPWAPNTIK